MALTGKVFGKWQVGRRVWECKCIYCGKQELLELHEILKNNERCGHYRRPGRWKYDRPRREIPEYTIWVQIRSRCRNPRAPGYTNYGGRGIKVCDRWDGVDGFVNFMADMGQRPEGQTLDRIDNNGPYSPENCRWATGTQQMRNRSNTRRATFNGKTKTLFEWAEETGIPYNILHMRLYKIKWPVKDALTTPVRSPGMTATWNGRSMKLTDWAKVTGIKYLTLLGRYHRGLCGDALFAVPKVRHTRAVVPMIGAP